MKNNRSKGDKMRSIAVFCGSSDGNKDSIGEKAYALGAFLAANGIELIYGGSKLGLMGKVAAGALEQQGRVTGVIPDFLTSKEVVHTGLTELIITNDMHERKMKMQELSEGFIALPGGFGTLEEFFEILTWAQLGLHKKPIGILNIDGFYDDLLKLMQKMVAKGFLKKENMNLVITAEKLEDLVEKMQNFEPLPVPKWMNRNQT